MNLFQVVKKSGKTSHTVQSKNGGGFGNKTTAKKWRDELGGVDAGFHVTFGPDHKKFNRGGVRQ